MVRKRGKGGIQGWIGENEICDAKHAIKIEKPIPYSPSNGVTENNPKISLRCKSRHFYFDGMAVAKFELIFVTKPTNISLSPKAFQTLMMEFFKTPIEIATPPDPRILPSIGSNPQSKTKRLPSKIVPLENLGRHLATLYLSSTTKKSCLKDMDNYWAMAGEPIFWVEFNAGEKLPTPLNSRLINSPMEDEITLYHWDVSPQKNLVKNVWMAKCLTTLPASKQTSRTARIILTRLNAEQETLWTVLKLIETGSIGRNNGEENTQALSYLQYYFNEATRRIFKLQKSSDKYFEPNEIGSLIRDSLEDINPGRHDALQQKIKLLEIRPQVAKKVRDYITQIFITENYMRDVYKVGQAGAVGPGAQANNITFQNSSDTNESIIEMAKLAEELKKLREQMELLSNHSEHVEEIEKIKAAENAANDGDKSKALQTLQHIGTWVLNIAEDIGASLVIAAIKSTLKV